jgi:hypothetical protein
MAVNCSKAVPDEFVVLQPVQLVSMAAVPGEIENVLPVVTPDTDPPQPASANRAGTAAAASSRTGRCRRTWDWKRRPVGCEGCFRCSNTAVVLWVNSSGAFLAARFAY